MIFQIQNLALLAAIVAAPLLTTCAGEATYDADTPVASLIASAKAARAQGQNSDALSYFDAAIVRNPEDYLTLFQRGATFLAMGRNAQAKSDFDSALKIRPDFEGALLQRAKIHARNAEWTYAKADYKNVGGKAENDLKELEEAEGAYYLAFEAEKQKKWEECVNHAGTAILVAGTTLNLRQLRARCRFEKGEIQEALADLARVVQMNPGDLDSYLKMSAMMVYSIGDGEKGLKEVKRCLHSDPESKPCKRLLREEKKILKEVEKVKGLMEKKSYASAAKVLVGSGEDIGLLMDIQEKTAAAVAEGWIHERASHGLYISHVEIACEAYYSMNSMKKAQPFCEEALKLNTNSLYGSLHKAANQVEEENYDAAIATLNVAHEQHPDAQIIQQKLQEAQTLLKRSKSKDYYKVLGVSRDADERTIKKAYRQATKEYHPDKARAKGLTKEAAEKKMAAINEAYEVLSDSELRARFDRGDDPNDPLANQGGHPFQQGGNPFAGFGGQQFVFQQSGPGGQRKMKFGGQGFPGGFPGGFGF